MVKNAFEAMSHPLSYQDAHEGYERIARRRREARADLERAADELVEAERLYRRGRAEARVRCEAPSAVERKEEIDALTADLRADRDRAKWSTEILKEKLAEIDADRATLHRLSEWSIKLTPMGEG